MRSFATPPIPGAAQLQWTLMEPAARHSVRTSITGVVVRRATGADLEALRRIYNEGIEDRIATLETDSKSNEEMAQWWEQHTDRYSVVVATDKGQVVGWASLNRFSHRCAHADIADLSVYVARSHRGVGIGAKLLLTLMQDAANEDFSRSCFMHSTLTSRESDSIERLDL